MSTSYWLDRSSKRPCRSYDVLIVGAGISGLSSAYWLNKEDPSLRIAIIEKSRLAFGASGRNAGFITCGSVEHFNRMVNRHGLERAAEIWRFADTNLKLLREEIIDSADLDLGFEQNGAFSLAAHENELEELKAAARLMESMNIRTEMLDAQAVENRVGAQRFVGGIKYPADASIHPVALIQQIRTRVNADLFEGVEAHKIERVRGDLRRLATDGGDFEAPLVLMNLNGYSAQLHPWFRDKIFPTRGQCFMTEPVPRFMEAPCYAHFYLDYFRQLPTGEVLIGGFRQLEKETEVGYSDHITEIIQAALQQFVQNHLPRCQGVRVTHRWSGVMGFARDGEPIVGSLPNDPQVFFAGGYTAHGLGLGFHATKCLVDAVYGRPIPDWLSARRFA